MSGLLRGWLAAGGVAAGLMACAAGVFEGDATGGTLRIERHADEAGVVIGLVALVDGRGPARRAVVVLQCTCIPQREVLTDEEGRFRFDGLVPGKYAIQVLHGDANVSRSFELGPQMRARVLFEVDPRKRLSPG